MQWLKQLSWNKLNPIVVFAPLVLFLFGYIGLLSTSPDRARLHVVFFAVGVILYLVVSLLDYRLYFSFWKVFYATSLGSLLLTYFIGDVRYGSARWIEIGPFAFQPSE